VACFGGVVARCGVWWIGGGGAFSRLAAIASQYTGVPGYGLCRISPDLKTWTRFGTDERLKGNIHGLVVFEHSESGKTLIAAAQNDDQRVLVIDPDTGAVLQELRAPAGGEFNHGPANHYYSNRPVKKVPWGSGGVGHGVAPGFAVTDVTHLHNRLCVCVCVACGVRACVARVYCARRRRV
jgi:hypothetical protein